MPVSARTRALDRKHAAMRVISEWVDEQRHQQCVRTPPWGTVGVGGADFEFLLKATVGEAYLRILRRGGTPEEAHVEAVAEGNYCVERWNSKTSRTRMSINGSYELQRWEKAGEAEADSVHLFYLALTRS